MLLPAMPVTIEGLSLVDRWPCRAQDVQPIVQDRLVGLDLSDRDVSGIACCLKGFLTVQGIGREDDAGQPKIADHLLGCGDFVRLFLDPRLRQKQGYGRGEGGQGLRRFAIVHMIEAAAQGLAIERDHRPFPR